MWVIQESVIWKIGCVTYLFWTQSILLYLLNENNFNRNFFITFSESQEESTPKGKIDGESNASSIENKIVEGNEISEFSEGVNCNTNKTMEKIDKSSLSSG